MSTCDTLIRKARVYDGSGADPEVADVALLGDRIAAIGPALSIHARRVVEAEGMALAPGFIDSHTHDDLSVIQAPAMEPRISQSVTTIIAGNCGISAAPVTLRGQPRDPMNLLGDAAAFRIGRYSVTDNAILPSSSRRRLLHAAAVSQMHRGPFLKRIFTFAAVLFSCLLASVLLWQQSEPAHGQARASLWVRSASFSDGGAIPSDHTCEGADLSPQLEWQSAPAGTKSFAIVVDDPDALADFTHWLVYNISPGHRGLPQNASTHAASHQGAAEGTNDFGRNGYEGPCPPPGKPHHYFFRVYALDRLLDLHPGVTRKQLDAAMSSHILAQGQIVGTYQRMGR